MEYLLVVTACRRTAGCDEKWIISNQSSVKSWPCPVAQSQRYYFVLWDHLSQDEREATICKCCRDRDLETILTKEKLCEEGRKIRPDSIFGCIPIKGIFIHLKYFFFHFATMPHNTFQYRSHWCPVHPQTQNLEYSVKISKWNKTPVTLQEQERKCGEEWMCLWKTYWIAAYR